MTDETVVTEDEVAEEEAPLDVVNAPLVVPELDLEGGTKFMVGDAEYGSMAEAQEAAAAIAGDDEELADTEAEDEPDPETPEA